MSKGKKLSKDTQKRARGSRSAKSRAAKGVAAKSKCAPEKKAKAKAAAGRKKASGGRRSVGARAGTASRKKEAPKKKPARAKKTVRRPRARACPSAGANTEVRTDARGREAASSKKPEKTLAREEKARVFLEALFSGEHEIMALRMARLQWRYVRLWLAPKAKEYDAEFTEVYAQAKEASAEYLRLVRQCSAHDRAVHGVKETIYYQGKPCGVRVHYSDQLLMAELKADDPERYRERVDQRTHGEIRFISQTPENDQPPEHLAPARVRKALA